MNPTLKNILIGAGVVLLLIGVGSLGYHLLKAQSPAEIILPPEPKQTEETQDIMVSVAGAVRSPGVYALKNGDRLYQLIDLAGGFSEEAATQYVNLALRLKDEDHFYIASIGEAVASTSNPAANHKINLNTADQQTLETLPGIGPSLAGRIIAYRQTNGSFKAIEEVKNVSGIGDKRYEAIKDLIIVR